MMITRMAYGAALTAALCGSTAALAKNSGPTLQDRQQAACYSDVQRLCGSAMPDAAKVEACMADKRPQVSKKCSDMWDVKS